jgi:hypothetical protein
MSQAKQSRTQPADVADNSLVDETAAATYLVLRPGTLAVWRSTGRYKLPYVKIGSRVRYRKRDLDAFIQAHTVGAETA